MRYVRIATEFSASLKEVAAALGVTVQRAQQIERAALKKCRRICAKRGIGLRDLIDAMPIGYHDTKPTLRRKPHLRGGE